MSSQLDTLLRYYTQLSLTHASIVVASIFGLFSVLRIISDKDRAPWSRRILGIVYLILLIFGIYEVSRYMFYADLAGNIAIHDFGAVDWSPQCESIHWLIDIFFDYTLLWYFLLGFFALVGGYDDLRRWIWANLIVKLKKKLIK